ncbi:MAG: polysaccharide lyase [Alphaproteobacteria bacterium]|nr:polysaccharide lyase [Alphaproteobacteria bacterium]
MRVAVAVAVLLSLAGHARGGELGTFHRSLSDTSHGYAVVQDPTGTGPAARVERFEVRPGDCGRSREWDDCANDRERSELAQDRSHRVGPGTEAWYGWSLYLPADLPNVHPTKAVFGQFIQTRSHPLFMFRQTVAGLVLDNQVDKTRSDLLIPETELRGRWHRFEVHARWSRGPDGFFTVYVNGDARADYRGVTMTAHEVYLKYGVYRTFVSRYRDARGVDAVPAQVAYFADMRGASTRAGLVDRP